MRGTLSVVEDRRPLARSGLLALLATLGIRQSLVSSLRLSLVLLPFRGLALFVRLLFLALFFILFAAFVSHCVITFLLVVDVQALDQHCRRSVARCPIEPTVFSESEKTSTP
jgi:hypothetical protein